MRIGIDARFYGTENSGLGRYTLNYLHALITLDHENEYFIFLKSKYAHKLKLPSNFHPIITDIPHYSLREQLQLPILIKKHHLDLFHSLHLNAPILTPTPLIVTIHDLIKSHFTSLDTTTRPAPTFFLKRLGYTIILRTLLIRARSIIVPSNFVKSDIIAQFPHLSSDKIVPIYEAPDPFFTSKHKSRPSRTPYILFVGNSYPHKNLSLLIQAFSRLKRQYPNLKLYLVSKQNPFLQKVLAQYSQSILKNIKVFQDITDSKLYALYKHAHLTITPSLMEGFGLVGLESLAVGTPVIASDIPVFREVYQDSVAYFDPTDEASLVKILKQSLSRRPKAKLPKRAYTWKKLATNVMEVYRETGSRLRSS